MVYLEKTFGNDFTFVRSNGKSQIDFCLTNSMGRRKIKDFTVILNDWHLSDHRPISLLIGIDTKPDLSGLVKRAYDLNFEHSPTSDEIKQLKGNYDYDAIQDYLLQHRAVIENNVNCKLVNDDTVGAIEILDEHIKSAHRGKKKRFEGNTASINMDNVNKLFEQYVKTLSDNSATEEDINTALMCYISARKSITVAVIKADESKWSDALKSADSKAFWKLVDWKGNLNKKKASVSPTIQEFEVFFQNLYSCDNNDELLEILQIESDVNVPILDEPITEEEVKTAWRSMKKSGYDYNMQILTLLVTFFSLMLTNLLNIWFYVKYPASLACSLLSLIPKKGNLKLPKNFRGIQMMKSLACLYDRVIANRLKLWLRFHDDQTAFQQWKSTLLHIFTLRILIEIVKKLGITLYVASVDIKKAFDNVPRSLL